MNTKRLQPRRRGYAMALLLVVMVVLTASTSLVLSAAANDTKSGRINTANASGRLLARSAADEVWAHVLTDPEFLDPVLSTNPNQDAIDHPAVGQSGGVDRWAALDDGGARSCASISEDCFHVDITRNITATNYQAGGYTGTTGAITAVKIRVTARVRCGKSLERCVYSRLDMRLRKRQFFDYLYYTKYSVLDPRLQNEAGNTAADAETLCADKRGTERDARCIEVSYQGQGDGQRDVINGPVFTDDTWISTCGDPEFQKPVFAVGGYTNAGVVQIYRPGSDGVCASSTPRLLGGANPSALELGLPSGTSTAEEIRQFAGGYVIRTGSTADVTFSVSGTGSARATQMTVSAPDVAARTYTLPNDDGSVVFIDAVNGVGGNARVRGVVSGRVSLFAFNDLRIAGSLTYNKGTGATNTTDVTGLTSLKGAIIIEKTGGALELHAVMLSLEQAIRVEGWSTADGFNGPGLNLYGAIAAKYQGVFGGFSSLTGGLVSGYRKNFQFDSRLSTNPDLQPPYLVSPLASSWDRLDISEIAPKAG